MDSSTSLAARRSNRLHRRRIHRWTGTVALVLQLFALSAVPVAEAAAERETSSASTHIEAEGSDRCPVAHDHLVCQLCRSITDVGAPSPHAATLDVDRVRIGTPGAPVALFFRSSSYLPLGSRAPPLS